VSMLLIIQCEGWLPRHLPPPAAFGGQLDGDSGNGVGVMAHQAGLPNQVAANHVDAHGANLVEIRLHWRRLLARIPAAQRGPDLASVYYRVIQQLASRVTVDSADV